MMMEPFKTVERDGFTINLRYEEIDQEVFDPRQDTNLGVMFCDHPRYDLGDEDAPDPREQEIECDRCEGEGEYPCDDSAAGDGRCTCEKCEGRGVVELSIVDYLKREHGARVILPLFLYDHSGITMHAGGRIDTGEDSFDRRNRFMADGAGWDTSSVGVIFSTKESRKECGCEDFTDERIEEALNAEVSEYAAYLEGEVFYWTVEDEDGEVIDSVSGYIGHESEDDMLAEANPAVDRAIAAREHEQAEAQRWACADVVTV